MANDPGMDYAVERARKRSNAELMHDLGRVPNPQNQENIAARIVLEERRLRNASEAEARSEAMHRELKGAMDDLKKPHWTVVPTFLIAIAAALFGAVAVFYSIYPIAP